MRFLHRSRSVFAKCLSTIASTELHSLAPPVISLANQAGVRHVHVFTERLLRTKRHLKIRASSTVFATNAQTSAPREYVV